MSRGWVRVGAHGGLGWMRVVGSGWARVGHCLAEGGGRRFRSTGLERFGRPFSLPHFQSSSFSKYLLVLLFVIISVIVIITTVAVIFILIIIFFVLLLFLLF